MWNPFLYPLTIPRLPNKNYKPPTIYQLLEAIVNYGKDDKTKIKNLAKDGRSKFFDFEYPLSSKVSKEEFETMILNKFMMRRIGFETLVAFKVALNVKLNEIMPIYNKMFDFLEGWDLFNDGEVTTRDRDYTGNNYISSGINSSSTNTSDRRFSELPQNEISNVQDGRYMTDYNYDTDNNTTNTNQSTSGNDSNREHEVITRSPADKIRIYREFLENKNNIYSMIFKDLEELFYQLV